MGRGWKQGQEDAWLGAATEDVSYKFQRMHLTHATDPLIDNERTKVLNDVAFTGCLDAATVMARDSSEHLDQERFIKTWVDLALRLTTRTGDQNRP